jgi:hypothetical protein
MSLIKTNDIQNASGGIPTVKGQQLIPTAWVHFNGVGTVAIRDSEGISSITDSGTGDYTANFAVAMANTNYSASSNVEPTVSNGGSDTYISSLATASCRLNHFEVGTRRDGNPCNIIVIGGQA